MSFEYQCSKACHSERSEFFVSKAQPGPGPLCFRASSIEVVYLIKKLISRTLYIDSIYVLSINTYYEGIACSYQVRWARVNSGPTPARENEKECALASVLHLKV